jgi:hypothetical protein
MSKRGGRRFQFFVRAVRLTARELEKALVPSATSAIGLLPASNRLSGAGATQMSVDESAVSVMSVIEYVLGPQR